MWCVGNIPANSYTYSVLFYLARYEWGGLWGKKGVRRAYPTVRCTGGQRTPKRLSSFRVVLPRGSVRPTQLTVNGEINIGISANVLSRDTIVKTTS